MGKAVSRGQALEVSARVATQVNWDELDGDRLQEEIISLKPGEFGRRFTAFLKSGGRIIVGEVKVVKIDRSQPFNPTEFMEEKGWTIKEQDKRSLAFTDLDLTKVQFKTMFKDGESSITGDEKLSRLKAAGHIRLDAKVFQTLWENKKLIPESWKKKIDGKVHYIFFDGTILRSPYGDRCVLSLCWRRRYGGMWCWAYRWLISDWDHGSPSAVLASS